jgi:hypothetical protein
LAITRRLVEFLPARGRVTWPGCALDSSVGSLEEGTMKYLVPPIVIPVLLFIGIAAYAMLGPPIIVGHAPAPAANAQPR